MPFLPITQCNRSLDFQPRTAWPNALPACAWQNILLTGFDRHDGLALDLWRQNGCTWLEAVMACYPTLGLAELARLRLRLEFVRPDLAGEFSEGLFAEHGLRWCERLSDTIRLLAQTPLEFQHWVDEKKMGARDLSPLLAIAPSLRPTCTPFLHAIVGLGLSKSQAAQVLEWFVELFLLGRPVNDLLPTDDNGVAYMARLGQWRRPHSSASDEQWRATVTGWPWPAQVQGQWQRFGDQSGLEVRIQTTSPQDFHKKLERLLSIRDTWSCQG